MFGIVANIVIGLMRSVFAIVSQAVSGVTGNVSTVVGPFAIQHTDGNIRWMWTPASQEALLSSSSVLEFRSGANLTSGRSAGIKRIADNVIGVYGAAGSSDPAWLQQGGGRKRVTAAVTPATDSTTFANVADLTYTLIAGRTYSFWGTLLLTTVATSGVKIDFNGGTATATDFHGVAIFNTAAGAATVQTAALATALGSTAAVLSVDIAGTITVNAAGTLILRAAQNAETAGAESVIVLRGSFLILEDMP